MNNDLFYEILHFDIGDNHLFREIISTVTFYYTAVHEQSTNVFTRIHLYV